MLSNAVHEHLYFLEGTLFRVSRNLLPVTYLGSEEAS